MAENLADYNPSNIAERAKARFSGAAVASTLRRNIGMILGRQLLVAFAQFLLVVLVTRELSSEGNDYYAWPYSFPPCWLIS